MYVVVRQKNGEVNEYRFTKGPLYIGRHANSQIFLPDRAVSRQHAVIFNTEDGKWMVEDMDSAGKTYLNDQPIHKAQLNNGDSIRIVDFTIEIKLDDNLNNDKPIDLEDTLVASTTREPQVIVRKADAEHAPAMRIPSRRTKDFAQASKAVGQITSLDNMLLLMLQIIKKQFNALTVWCALRNSPAGPMSSHLGKNRMGLTVNFDDIEMNDKITQAIDNSEFLLMPRIPADKTEKNIGSVMIAPFVGPGGCFGVIYLDNDKAHPRYGVGDLDYLMLLAVHAATCIERL